MNKIMEGLTRMDKDEIRSYLDGKERFTVSSWDNPDLNNELMHSAGACVSCSVFHQSVRGSWVEVPYTSHSDYGGSTVEEANCKYIEDQYSEIKGLVRVYGGWSTDGYYVNVRALVRSAIDRDGLLDDLIRLDDYPLFDDELLSIVEMDILYSAFDDWAKYDFIRGLELAGRNITEWPDDNQRQLFYDAEHKWEDDNRYPEFESHESCYLDIDAIVEYAIEILDENNLWLIDFMGLEK